MAWVRMASRNQNLKRTINTTHRTKFRVTLLSVCLLLVLSACSQDCDCETLSASSNDHGGSKKITLRVAHGWPSGYPIFAESVDDYAEMVSAMSDGRIELRVDSATKHKSAFGIFDFVKSGQYDIGQTASYYYGGKDPDALFFSSMPFSMTTAEQTAWFYHGGGLELPNQVYEKHNIELMLGGNTGMQMGGWFRKEINSIEDLSGLKMRIPGFGGKVMAGVGVQPTNIPAGELYQALERGTIDALEWVGPGLDLRMGFHKVAPYYYTGWHEPGTELLYFFNKDSMAKLPEWAKEILFNAAKLTAYSMSTETFAANADNLAVMQEQFPELKIRKFPAPVIAALKSSNQQLLNEEMARSDIAKEIIESRAAFLKKARAWTEVGVKAYLDPMSEPKPD